MLSVVVASDESDGRQPRVGRVTDEEAVGADVVGDREAEVAHHRAHHLIHLRVHDEARPLVVLRRLEVDDRQLAAVGRMALPFLPFFSASRGCRTRG